MFIFLCILLLDATSVFCNPTLYDQRQTGKTNVRVEVKDAVIIAVGDGELGGDYDYSYDYSDLTIKPGRPPSSTTSVSASSTPVSAPTSTLSDETTYKATATSPTIVEAATTTTVAAAAPPNFNISQNAAVVLEAENNSIIFPANKPVNGSLDPIKILPATHKPDQIPVLVLQESNSSNRPHKFLPVKTVEKHYVSSSRIRAKTSNGTINTEELPPRHCSPGFFLDNHNRCKQIRRPSRERPQLPIGFRFDHRPRN